jgi:hypothetical protein
LNVDGGLSVSAHFPGSLNKIVNIKLFLTNQVVSHFETWPTSSKNGQIVICWLSKTALCALSPLLSKKNPHHRRGILIFANWSRQVLNFEEEETEVVAGMK